MADEREELVTERFAAESLVQSGADDLERAAEAALRPRRLDEFVGQRVVRDQLSLVLAGRARPRARRRTTCCSPGRPGSARRRSR